MNLARTRGAMSEGNPSESTAPPHGRKNSARRTAVRAASALVVLALGGGLLAGAATADSNNWERYRGGTTGGGAYFGNFAGNDGGTTIFGVCAAQGANYGPGPQSFRPDQYSDPSVVSSYNTSTYDGGTGPTVSGSDVQTTAYLMSMWGDSSSTAEAVSVDLALIRHSGVELSWQASEANSIAGGASTRANQMIAEAEANRGPYVANQPVVTLDPGARAGDVGGIGIRNGAGNFMAGRAYTATISGPAVFESNGSATITGTSAASAQSLALRSTGNGQVRVTVTFNNMPDDRLWRMSPLNGTQAQALFLGGAERSFSASGDPVNMVFDFQPTATTAVSEQYVLPGDSVTDQVTAAGTGWTIVGGAYVPVTYEGTLYGPFAAPQAQQATVPAGSPVAGTTSLTFNGPGTQTSAGIEVPETGYYTWVWTVTKAEQPASVRDYIRADFAAPFFEHVETNMVRETPGATSEIDPGDVLSLPGDPILDVITFEGFPENHGDQGALGDFRADNTSATHTIYGPFSEQPNEETNPVDLASAPVVSDVDTEAYNGDFEALFTGPDAPTAPGHYVVVTTYAGDDRSAPFTTSQYDTSEMFQVAENPTAVTQAQPDALPGTQFNDVVEVTDPDSIIEWDEASGRWDWQVEFTAVYAGDVPPLEVDADGNVVGEVTPEIAEVCDGEPFFTSRTDITGAGTYESEYTTYEQVGNVFWVERLVRIDLEGEFEDQYVTEGICGLPNETTEIVPGPEVVTQAQDHSLTGDMGTEDTALVTDPEGAFETETSYRWYVEFRAFGPTDVAALELDADGNPVLDEVPVLDEDGNPVLDADGNPVTEQVVPEEIAAICNGEPFFTSEQITVTGEGEYVSGRTGAIETSGNMFWVEDLYAVPVNPETGEDLTEAVLIHKGVCGLPNETTVVEDTPEVVTQATPSITVGESSEDIATVTDPSGTIAEGNWSFTVQFNAYGPQDANATPVCDGEPFFTSERVTVTGAGDYKSGKTPAVNTPGNLYWVEDLYATPLDENGEVAGEEVLVHQGECGIPNETTTVNPQPSNGDGGAGAGNGLAITGADLGSAAMFGLGVLLIGGAAFGAERVVTARRNQKAQAQS